jgi:2-keto-4-pentenoate hydratase/2-oxohepta-3-ene-1,7-dioic acid hydratase in catechol pathway
MKFVRFAKDGGAAYGIVDGDTVKEISNSPIGQDYKETGATQSLDSIKILAPNPNPGKMLCLALNYGSHLLGPGPRFRLHSW